MLDGKTNWRRPRPLTHSAFRAAGLLTLGLLFILSGIGCGGDKVDEAAAASDSTAGASAEGDTTKAAPKKKKKKRRETTLNVNAAKVVRGELVIPVIAEGSIRAVRSAEIKSEITGRIDRIFVKEGQGVRRGQKLIELDGREYRITLEEAEAEYLESLGRLAVEDEGEDDQSAGEELQAKLVELESLERRGAITRSERRERSLALEVAAVKKGLYREELVQIRNGLAAARSQVERAKLDLEHTVVTAPFAGVITNLTLSPGERVSLGGALCRLVDNLNLEAEVAVLESDLGSLEQGREALLEVPALGETLLVKADVISPDIDPESRTCRVLMRFSNDDGRARPGMFVRAAIAGEIHPDLLLVPRESILTRDGRPLLFKVKKDRAEWVYVRLGRSNDRLVEVERVLQGGPLDPGTLVVVSDHLTLTHQAKVKVKKVLENTMVWTSSSSD